jgi:tetratricopeptide (TPR) repeat protein
MSKLRLAVPTGSFLLFVLAPLGFAQSNPSAPVAPPSANATTDETRKLSDEELGRLYLARKEYREAQDVFHKLTVEHPKNAVYWNELGISLHSQTDLSSALKCYEKSTKLDRHYPDPQNNIGTIYYARKKYPKAIRAYKRAIAIKDDSSAFYLNLGYAYFAHKQYEESITSFRKALAIDPDAFDAAKSRSGTIVQDRSLSSDRAHFYFLLAKSFAQSGNAERCAIYLKKARDEGYQEMNSVNSDPAFAKIIKDPAIQEVLTAKPPDTAQQ